MTLHNAKTLFAYNAWARERILAAVGQLSREEYRRDGGSSHGGIHGTLVHMLSAEEVWLKRWRGETPTGLRRPEEFESFEALRAAWQRLEESLSSFLGTLAGDGDIGRELSYSDLRGNPFRQPLGELMQHVVNHSTYHRGQIVTLLRQAGIKPPDTDLVIFLREQSATHRISG